MFSTPDRRTLLKSVGLAGAGALMPGFARAQAQTLVAATFPGTWNEAHRQVLLPAFVKRTGAKATQSIILGTDQISRLSAAKGGKPPFDVAFFDSPQVIDAVKQGLIVEYPVAKSPNYASLLPEFQDKWGPRVSVQVIGIGYNPKKIKNPPKSWDALWDPQYKGRVGLTALNSQLGIAFLAEINRLRGGADDNFDAGFKALRELLPNVGAIGANLGAFATLWQQEQIDIAPYNFNFVQTLKAKDVPVELSIPDTGPVGWHTSMHIVANAEAPDLAAAYIDTNLDPAVQAAMQKPPFDIIPSNSNVPLEGAITQSIAKTHADLAKVRAINWEKIGPMRSALIEQFNREVKI
ncbi:MAG: extracellular solute-binding protein [Methylobacteriaceae bacterium]|nr:extracellular solute-binding protein [Rhodoblastus sp.]MCC0003902.1 extracellular solute-binding protein [Methylobacteriaceae bacterium]